MPATSSEDVRGILRSFSAALGEPEKESLDSYLSHLGHVGDEMVAGLGGMLTDSFPEVPSLVAIHELYMYTFSKTDALLLGRAAQTERKVSECTCTRIQISDSLYTYFGHRSGGADALCTFDHSGATCAFQQLLQLLQQHYYNHYNNTTPIYEHLRHAEPLRLVPPFAGNATASQLRPMLRNLVRQAAAVYSGRESSIVYK